MKYLTSLKGDFLGSWRWQIMAVMLAFSIFFQLLGFLLGQDVNWDQLNYHLSSVHMWLNGENWNDFAISQRQSWFNPVATLPPYLVVMGFSGRAAAVVLALFPLANALAIYALARRFIFKGDDIFQVILAFACVLVGVTGTIHLMVVATTFSESWLSSAVIWACFFLMAAAETGDERLRSRYLLAAGFLLGAATGIKITNAPYCVGGFVGATFAVCFSTARLKCLVWFVGGGIVGFALGGGWWHWHVWSVYGDPAFPMLSSVFHSPWIGPDDVPPEPYHYARDHVWQLFLDPFALALGDHSRPLATPAPVRDARYLIGLYGAIALLGGSAWLWTKGRLTPEKRTLATMGLFFFTSYLVWTIAFNVDRYAVPLELMSATVASAVAVWFGWVKKPAGQLSILALLGLILVTTHPIKTGRRAFSDTWLDVAVPPQLARANTLYVLTGSEALSWLILFEDKLGAPASFVRVGGNLTIDPDRPLGGRISKKIAGHVGEVRSLSAEPEARAAQAELARFGLSIVDGSCLRIDNKFMPVRSCLLERRLRLRRPPLAT